MSEKNRVIIFDTTLRDGEQAAGGTMSGEQKIIIAKALDKMGVDVIEAGFAAASQGEFETISKIASQAQNAVICSLARSTKNDILSAFEAIKNAPRKRIHTFISTSDIHIKYKLQKTHEQVLEMIKSSVGYAKSLTDDIEWSAEDATRTDVEFLHKCVETAINEGATTINIPDTVGYNTPSEYYALIKMLVDSFASKNVIFSSHCHNDLGLAVANSLAALNAGARQVECTINGIGERAGNAALEEIVMAIKVRNDVLNYKTNINTKHIMALSNLVSNTTGFIIQKNKAIVGQNAFAHASGIHQDGMIKNSQTYEIINPADVGLEKASLVLGKLSGKAALKEKLLELAINLTNEELEQVFVNFKKLCDTKQTIYDNDLLLLVQQLNGDSGESINKNNLISYNISYTNNQITITINTIFNGVEKSASFYGGNGILDNGFCAINKLFNKNPKLEDYSLKAATNDADSQAIANVLLSFNEKQYFAKAYNSDVVLASLQAYFNACVEIG